MSKSKATKRDRSSASAADVPYTMKLPGGRTLLVLIPAAWCETDVSGAMAFRPQAVRLLDRVRVAATSVPAKPTPGYILTLREALGLTQTQLGERLGVDKMTVARCEWGKMAPGAAALKALDRLRRELGRRGLTIAA